MSSCLESEGQLSSFSMDVLNFLKLLVSSSDFTEGKKGGSSFLLSIAEKSRPLKNEHSFMPLIPLSLFQILLLGSFSSRLLISLLALLSMFLGYLTLSFTILLNRSSVLSASKGVQPTIISYNTTPREYQSDDLS